jgi:glutamyl-tRNA synthetase/glutamyl-Q tRNA(Asp) synthetase
VTHQLPSPPPVAGPPPVATGRFAPSTTGDAHPGTLLAGLLCWLDARSRGAVLRLRLEDLDTTRCKPAWAEAIRTSLDWLGLDWDHLDVQSQHAARHEAALDALAASGRLYPCACTRTQLRTHGRPAPDGGLAYDNRCRGRRLPPAGWRAAQGALRVDLAGVEVRLRCESGLDLSQSPGQTMGDPVVRRRDGIIAYQLAVVVDDAATGVTRVVRGRDLAASTATQVALQEALSLPRPIYRHHLLLLEPRGDKLAKFHGSVGTSVLRQHHDAAALCGILAHAAGLRPTPERCTPRQLLADFAWSKVRQADRVLTWRAGALLAGD